MFVRGFKFGKFFCRIDAVKQVFAFFHLFSLQHSAKSGNGIEVCRRLHSEFGKNLVGGLRNKRRKQGCRKADTFAQNVHNGCQTGFVALFVKYPRRRFVYVLVGSLNDFEYVGKGVGRGKIVHIRSPLVRRGGAKSDKFLVQLVVSLRSRHSSAEVLTYHCGGAADQVAQVVYQVAVGASDKRFGGVVSIAAEGNFSQQKVPHGVRAVAIGKEKRIYAVAERFAHFLVAHKQPTVSVNLFGKGQV